MPEEYFAIVVSDLHLGEEDSIFMDLEGQFQPKVAEKIKNLIASKTDPQKLKYLILAGDAMDLSLASRPQAFKAFRGFLAPVSYLWNEHYANNTTATCFFNEKWHVVSLVCCIH